ncbi:hypothetical protein OF897_20420 [Chryseobacterium formosus]|uniref:Uncharacterized protein n=1 Tax=Chryseobacterium formosus TaxID=1537363 RepID=A0ABT3XX90_9FLAO|nr:hypothetical protein [Chryseobacterium formosus]MCX8526286.1 hypothetical protein [Chryseobacterium formosus]
MGELHGVNQLKPKIILGGAILQVKKEKEKEFLDKYSNEFTYIGNWGISENTFATISDDGIVERYAMYYEDKVIDFKRPGIYIQIQGQSKYGPKGNSYIDFISNVAVYLEDALFCVDYYDTVDQYEIIDGILTYQNKGKFDYFDEYLILNYASSPEIIACYYAEEINETKLRHEEMIKIDSDPKEMYDQEDYEDLLNKINNYKEYISIEKFTKLEDWLKVQINYYKNE